MKAEYTDKSYVVGDYNYHTLKWESTTFPHGTSVEIRGSVPTPYGFVRVDSWWDSRDNKGTRLEIIVDGRRYERSIWDSHYAVRYLVTLAKRFAQEVSDGSTEK